MAILWKNLEDIPWRREWLPTPVFLPGELHGQRSLVGYSPCGHKESDTTERLTHTCARTHTHTHTGIRGQIRRADSGVKSEG